MSKQTLRPLWRLLILVRNANDEVILTCDDCFQILEYLADTHHKIWPDDDFLRMIANKHLSCCPDCHQYYLKKLEQLEK
jgi:hypothetical protein